MDGYNEDFWKALDELVNSSEIVIDRPRGSAHPRFPNFIYKVDYGYLKKPPLWMVQELMYGSEAVIKRLMPSCVSLI